MTKNLIVCFLIHITSLNWPTTYGEKGDTEGKGKVGQHLPTFSLLFITYQVQNIDRMCIHQEVKFKSYFCVAFLLFW